MREVVHMDASRNEALKAYETELVMALRVQRVPGERIGEVVAEVQAHVADSGEDPTVAFGPAQQYAKQFESGPRRRFDRVIDPRTGGEIHRWPRWVPVLMVTTWICVMAIFWLLR